MIAVSLVRRSAPGQLDGVALRPQPFGDAITVVSLDFDGAILDGATGAAKPFQFAGQRIECRAPFR
jgi:hypothetical protein